MRWPQKGKGKSVQVGLGQDIFNWLGKVRIDQWFSTLEAWRPT